MVQRWTGASVTPSDAGGFVSYGDYLEMQRENERLWAALTKENKMTDKEFELQHDLGQAKERIEQYTATIISLMREVANLKETLRGIAEYAVERGAVADLPTEPLWVIR